MRREADDEARCGQLVKSFGGRYIKLNPLANAKIPDRLALLPPGLVIFVEHKRQGMRGKDGQSRDDGQSYWGRWLVKRGFNYACVESYDEFRALLATYREKLEG